MKEVPAHDLPEEVRKAFDLLLDWVLDRRQNPPERIGYGKPAHVAFGPVADWWAQQREVRRGR